MQKTADEFNRASLLEFEMQQPGCLGNAATNLRCGLLGEIMMPANVACPTRVVRGIGVVHQALVRRRCEQR